MDAHINMDVYHPTFDFNHAVFSDTFAHFQQMIHEYNLPDDVVKNAVHDACDFFHMDDLQVKPDVSTGVYTNDPTVLNDDCLGFSRQQMLDMGIHDEQSLSLICTHEAAHCMLQYLSTTHELSNWQEELSCDAFMGVRASLQGIDTTVIEKSLGDESASPTHPYGDLRLRYIEIGKHIGDDLRNHDLPVTAQNVLARLNDYIENDATEIFKKEAIVNEIALQEGANHHAASSETTGSVGFAEHASSETTGSVGFHGITYTESEINERKHRVENCEERIRNLQHDLDLAKSKESILRDNKDRAADHARVCNEISDLNRKLHSANIDLGNAKSAYNATQ